MNIVSTLSDLELLERIPLLVQAERRASAEVIEHLVEIDRRRLFLGQACSSLYSYCLERLGYSEDESHTRVRVARLAESFPAVLEELRSGAIHLTGLFLLSNHLTDGNHEAVLAASRGKSRRALEQLIAAWFPRPDVEQRVTPLPEQPTLGAGAPATRPEPGSSGSSVALPPRLEPLSPSRYRVEFTAGAELAAKIDQARALISHKLPSGDLAAIFEQALDHLIREETKRRIGAGRRNKDASSSSRRRGRSSARSRYIPREVARQIWQRDDWQCTFVDDQGRRCSERRFLTIEHRQPHALGGPATVDSLCLLCKSHNAHTARQVFGEQQIASEIRKRERSRTKADEGKAPPAEQPTSPAQAAASSQPEERSAITKVHFALRNMGFRERETRETVAEIQRLGIEPSLEPLLRKALELLGSQRR
jgi:hypothetical protein